MLWKVWGQNRNWNGKADLNLMSFSMPIHDANHYTTRPINLYFESVKSSCDSYHQQDTGCKLCAGGIVLKWSRYFVELILT